MVLTETSMVPPETCMNCQPVTPKHCRWIITYTKICMILKHVSIKSRQVHATPFNKYSRIVRCEKKVTNKWENTLIYWTKQTKMMPQTKIKREREKTFFFILWYKTVLGKKSTNHTVTGQTKNTPTYTYRNDRMYNSIDLHWVGWVI